MTMAVNKQGVLGVLVVELQVRRRLFFVDSYASLDGGASFIGDYFGLISTPDGQFRALWPGDACPLGSSADYEDRGSIVA